MKRPIFWLAICLLPFTALSQNSLEKKLQSILSALTSDDELGYYILPPETTIAGTERSGDQLTIKLDIPIYYLDHELDAELAEEVIEHFAVPMSAFGFYTVFVKAQNEFGLLLSPRRFSK